jgi:hypothetical protein
LAKTVSKECIRCKSQRVVKAGFKKLVKEKVKFKSINAKNVKRTLQEERSIIDWRRRR